MEELEARVGFSIGFEVYDREVKELE